MQKNKKDDIKKDLPRYEYVNREDNIAAVISKYPEAAEVLMAFGLHCVGCFANTFDSVEAGCEIHGMGTPEVDEMLEEVNYVIKDKLGK